MLKIMHIWAKENTSLEKEEDGKSAKRSKWKCGESQYIELNFPEKEWKYRRNEIKVSHWTKDDKRAKSNFLELIRKYETQFTDNYEC